MTAICFAGCSKTEENAVVDTSIQVQVAETILTSFSQMTEDVFEQFKNMSDYQLEYNMMTTGLPVSGEDFLSVIKAWESAEDECGAFVEYGELKTEVNGSEVAVTTEAKYEDRQATITFQFNEDSKLESMDVAAEYQISEILVKAVLNTVLGMGTVFAVLIFLAFLIYCMKFIPSILEKLHGKKDTSDQQAKAVPVVQEQVEETDDLELVAVITAAIAAKEGTSSDGFVVRSIRRRPSNHWN